MSPIFPHWTVTTISQKTLRTKIIFSEASKSRNSFHICLLNQYQFALIGSIQESIVIMRNRYQISSDPDLLSDTRYHTLSFVVMLLVGTLDTVKQLIYMYVRVVNIL